MNWHIDVQQATKLVVPNHLESMAYATRARTRGIEERDVIGKIRDIQLEISLDILRQSVARFTDDLFRT